MQFRFATTVVIIVLAYPLMGSSGCSTGSTTSGSGDAASGAHQGNTPTTAGTSIAHCRKVTGTYLFQVQHRPFNAAYRRGIDEACKQADPSTPVQALAKVAEEIAQGKL